MKVPLTLPRSSYSHCLPVQVNTPWVADTSSLGTIT